MAKRAVSPKRKSAVKSTKSKVAARPAPAKKAAASGKRPAPKSAAAPAKKKAPKKAGKTPLPKGPQPVSTGRGATPSEIGVDLIALFNAGKADLVESRWWSPDVVSVEGVGVGLAWHGRGAADAKNREWMSKHTVLGASAEGPYVGSSGFAVKFHMHVRENQSGREQRFDEVGVFTVSEGKIIREEFMYALG